MECVRSFAHLSSIAAFPQALRRATKPKKSSCRVTAKLNSNDDPLLQAAIHAATLRFQETHRPGMSFSLISLSHVSKFSFRHIVEQLAGVPL